MYDGNTKKEIRWCIYNFAFRVFGKTRLGLDWVLLFGDNQFS